MLSCVLKICVTQLSSQYLMIYGLPITFFDFHPYNEEQYKWVHLRILAKYNGNWTRYDWQYSFSSLHCKQSTYIYHIFI